MTPERFFTSDVFVAEIEFAEHPPDAGRAPDRVGVRTWMPPRVINSVAALTVAGVLSLPLILPAALSQVDAASALHFIRKAQAPPVAGATLNEEQQARVVRFNKFFSSVPQSEVERRLDVDYGF
jgi:hypothetical protein